MQLLIAIDKTVIEKNRDKILEMIELCEAAVPKGDKLLYVPLSGKLIQIVQLLKANKIIYEVTVDGPEE